MSKLAALTGLRDLLADLYPTRESSYRVVDEAGLRRGPIAFHNAALDNWQSILVEAHRRGQVGALVDVAAKDYEAQEAPLRAALQVYEDAPEAEEDLDPGGRRKRPWLLVVAGAALLVVLYFELRPPPGAQAGFLCLVPNSSLLTSAMEPGRMTFEIAARPDLPPALRGALPERVLCLRLGDSDEGAGAALGTAWQGSLVKACVDDVLGEEESAMVEWWDPPPELLELSLDLNSKAYLKILDNGTEWAEGSADFRESSQPGVRFVCVDQDLSSAP